MASRDWWTDWNLNYATDAFGPMFGSQSVQEAMYNTLQKWLPSYIAEINRQLGSKVLTEPYEYRHQPQYRNLPKYATAAVLVEVPSTIGIPSFYQDGIRTTFRAEVLIYVYGTKDWQETQAMTSAYATAVRSAIIQNRGLGGLATTTLWEGEQYMEGEHSAGRTTGIAHLRFAVTISSVLDPYGGFPEPQFAPTGAPLGPSTSPPNTPPTIESTDVTITKE